VESADGEEGFTFIDEGHHALNKPFVAVVV